MGLDLMMYNKREYNQFYDEDYKKVTELAYGRKTWAIEHYFALRSEDIDGQNWRYDVPEEAWEEFYNTAQSLGFDKFKIWVDILVDFERVDDNEEDDEEYNETILPVYRKVLNGVEEFMKAMFHDSYNYQLGITWEAQAVVRWVLAFPQVKETYERGDGVIMIASY